MSQLRLFCSCEAIDFSIANEGSVTSTEEVRCTVEISWATLLGLETQSFTSLLYTYIILYQYHFVFPVSGMMIPQFTWYRAGGFKIAFPSFFPSCFTSWHQMAHLLPPGRQRSAPNLRGDWHRLLEFRRIRWKWGPLVFLTFKPKFMQTLHLISFNIVKHHEIFIWYHLIINYIR